jgi:hypothetical protein
VSHARSSRVHDREFFRMSEIPTKKCRGVQRLPTAYLLPIVVQTEIRHLRLKGSFGQTISLLVADEVTRPNERFGHIVARLECCFACVGHAIKKLRCAVIVLNYGQHVAHAHTPDSRIDGGIESAHRDVPIRR